MDVTCAKGSSPDTKLEVHVKSKNVSATHAGALSPLPESEKNKENIYAKANEQKLKLKLLKHIYNLPVASHLGQKKTLKLL